MATTSERGYGMAHRRMRERWRPLVESGNALCARCGYPIEPGSPWDMGHVEGSSSEHSGPEHVRCNRRAGGRNGARVRWRRPRAAPWSRDWF